MAECILCTEVGGKLIYQNELLRVVVVDDAPSYPGYVRLIINQHIKEMTDLALTNAHAIFTALFKLEQVVRQVYQPDKVNLASLGNMVPHLHWHIIPRYINDKHYPNPIWGAVSNHDYCPAAKLRQATEELVAAVVTALL